MGLECLELACQHLVVSVSADKDHIVEVAVKSHFICVQGEPCVDTLFNDASLRVRTQVLVMEDDVVLDESVFECPFAVQKVSVLCILDSEASSVIMCFSDVQEFPVDAEVLGDEFRDEAEKVLYVYV